MTALHYEDKDREENRWRNRETEDYDPNRLIICQSRYVRISRPDAVLRINSSWTCWQTGTVDPCLPPTCRCLESVVDPFLTLDLCEFNSPEVPAVD